MKEIERFLELPAKIDELEQRIDRLAAKIAALRPGAPNPIAKEELPEKLLYTIEDVCAILSVSRRTVRQIIAKGYLPIHKIGRLTRFRRKDLLKLGQIDIGDLDWETRPWPRDRANDAEAGKSAPIAKDGHSEGQSRDSREIE